MERFTNSHNGRMDGENLVKLVEMVKLTTLIKEKSLFLCRNYFWTFLLAAERTAILILSFELFMIIELLCNIEFCI